MANPPSSVQAFIANPWVGFAFGILVLVLGWKLNATNANWLLLVAWVILSASAFRTSPLSEQMMLPRLLWTALFAASAALAIYYTLWSETASEPPPSKPKTVFELFQNDFPALLKIDSGTEFVDGKTNTKIKITFREYRDFESKSKFVSFYVPFSASTSDACRLMLDAFQGFLDESDKVKVGASVTGAPAMTWSKDLLFTGKFFVYHESDLTLEEQGQLSALYKSKGFVIEFRGQSYVTARFLQSRAK